MSLPHFTLRQLEAFVTVAEMRSFTAAADRLALTPSAVSQLVGELEDVLDFKLFERSTRRVGITSAGREFLASAESVLKHLRMAQTAASDVRNRAAGVVRIAAPLVVASVILPRAIKAYQQTRPKVRIHIRDVPVEKLVDAVASGDADVGLGTEYTARIQGLGFVPLTDERYLLVCLKSALEQAPVLLAWEQAP